MVDFLQEVDNRVHKPSLADRLDLVCIGKIPNRMPDKCCQCIPYYKQKSFTRMKIYRTFNKSISLYS